MSTLQRKLLTDIEEIAREHSDSLVIDGPKYSTDFGCEFFSFQLLKAKISGSVFPEDANFWDQAGLDERFERVDFSSDDAYSNTIQSELIKNMKNRGPKHG